MSEALEILKSCDAFLEGHFLLSSGRHSGAYCQMAYLQQYPDRCAEVMKAVADKVKEMDVDVIVGPAMGGIVYAYELARQTGKRAIFTERVDNVMCLKRFAIHPGEKCIIAEDVVTTGISSLETKRVIEEAGGICLGITCVVDRREPVQLAERFLGEADMVLAEGFSLAAGEKIEVLRRACDRPPRCAIEDGLIAIVTDMDEIYPQLPHFGLDDLRGLADFLLARTAQ